MASASSNIESLDPDYIKFLLDPKLEFGCYFMVGKDKEKIGVVRKMLAAHSTEFRAQLLYRQRESKKPEEIKDLRPTTFKNLLRFVYGFDTTATMSFEDANGLFYASDKYFIKRLYDKLATRLMFLLDYTNVCALLTNPAFATALDEHSSIVKLLQCETDKVLSTPQFLSCCPDTFVKILEQEVMNITELQVWKAAVKWAKNKAKDEDPKALRQQLEKPLHYIRVCSLTRDEFCDEVLPTEILTNEEAGVVSNAIETRRKPETLTTVCNNMQVRERSTVCVNQGILDWVKSDELKVYIPSYAWVNALLEYSFSLETHDVAVELVALTCYLNREGPYTVTVWIESRQSTKQTITHTGQHAGRTLDKILTSTEQKPVLLLANTKYKIILSSDALVCVGGHTHGGVMTLEHFNLEFLQCGNHQGTPVLYIHYRTLTLR